MNGYPLRKVPNRNSRAARSYVLRGGRISKTRQAILRCEDYFLPTEELPLNWQHSFAHAPKSITKAKKVVEIGFGNGESLLAAASSRRQDYFIGIEVYPNGIAALLLTAQKEKIHNIRVLRADAAQYMDLCFAAESLNEIRIFFPDPWPKRRHHKRRLLSPAFLTRLLSRLDRNGLLHIVTDEEDYARNILHRLQAAKDCHNLYESYAPLLSNNRQSTKYERRAQRQGSSIFEMLFVKQ